MGNQAEERYRVFAEEYVKTDKNPRQAAINAGYSAKTASQTASRLLKNVKVKEFINNLTSDAIANSKAQTIATAQDILVFLTGVMQGTVKERKGKPALMRERVKAAELLAKKYGLLTEKMELSGNVDISAVIAKARKRAECAEND